MLCYAGDFRLLLWNDGVILSWMPACLGFLLCGTTGIWNELIFCGETFLHVLSCGEYSKLLLLLFNLI